MTNLELKQKIMEYIRFSSVTQEDRMFLIKYVALELDGEPDLECDINDSSYKNILILLSLFYNNFRLVTDNSLTRKRARRAFDIVSQVDKSSDAELDHLAFELLKLNYASGVDLKCLGSKSIVYKKVNERREV